MKIEPLCEPYLVLRADDGFVLKQKNIQWQKGEMFIVHRSALGWYEEIPKAVVCSNGQLLFGFME